MAGVRRKLVFAPDGTLRTWHREAPVSAALPGYAQRTHVKGEGTSAKPLAGLEGP